MCFTLTSGVGWGWGWGGEGADSQFKKKSLFTETSIFSHILESDGFFFFFFFFC